ncbi:MAG: hypothetical protein P8I94_06270, partial [Emcibacteraceae bacterium]|nr:hypothetical protein [Emcibacteraceae bacterium]
DQEFEEVMRLRDMGIAIPDHVAVQSSRLTSRVEIADFLKNSQGFGEKSEEQLEMEQLQSVHAIEMLKNETEKADAEIEKLKAETREKMLKADSMEEFNQWDLELRKLQLQRDMKQADMQMRNDLANQSHTSQGSQNDKRIASQIAMKSMDAVLASSKENSNTTKQAKTPTNKKDI